MKKTIRNIACLTLFFSLLFLSVPVSASEITIRPFLIDRSLLPRDEVQEIVTLKSDYEFRKAILYATVNEITIGGDGEIKEFITPSMTDRTNTVTSWIEVSRGRIEIPHGETREVPISLNINPFAKPGIYHAFVGFVEAADRPKAELIAMEGDAKGVIVKITIVDERESSMNITAFLIDRFIVENKNREVEIQIENVGDFTSLPEGEIILYDSRGKEITSFPVNTEGLEVETGQTLSIMEEIPPLENIGRIKANLALKYGEESSSLQDTTYFYLVPIKILLIVFLGVLIGSLFLALLFRRTFMVHNEDSEFDEVVMYVKDGHKPNPKDHDIDLKNNS